MLGGAAVHFALAASFFEEVRVVGPVGDDFGETELDVLRNRGVDISDVERISGGKTFFWRGKYGWDLNSRETLDTQLGVFEGFQPKLSEVSRSSDVLFLANIQPDLQREVRAQLPDARFVALDSMNLWIEAARDSLVRAIIRVRLPDPQRLRAAPADRQAEPRLARRARSSTGAPAAVIVAKQGEYGAALVTADGFFSLPAFPLESVVDPTGAGDTFAGGFVGYIAAHAEEELSDELLRQAMAHGTALASFNVEEFGTERDREPRGGRDRRARAPAARVHQLQRPAAAAARARSTPPARTAAYGRPCRLSHARRRHAWTTPRSYERPNR